MFEKDFYIKSKEVAYLDSACSALKLKLALKAFEDVCSWGGCGGKRTTHLYSSKVEGYFTNSKKIISQIINSEPNEIIFTSGTTDSFNKIAQSIFLHEGKDIIISSLEHNSVFFPFYEKAKREKYNLVIIPLKNYKLDLDTYKKIISKKTSIVALTMASNIVGGSVNVEDFIKITKEKAPNAFIILDAAQYITSHKIDVKKLDCDALCFSGHKIGAPYGIGVLYIKKESLNKFNYSYRGGGTVKSIIFNNKNITIKYLDFPQGFEAGIQNYSGAWALAIALKKLDDISYYKIRNHISSLIRYTIQRLSEIENITIIGSDLEEGSIVSFIPNNKKFSIKDFEIFTSLQKPTVAFRTGRMCADLVCKQLNIHGVIRLSFFIYNEKRDIDIFIDILKKYLRNI
ncbi:MAG: aminotransferase class V-fold PLP-dependent enzyme [Elusimicrobiales bacterium]|nr:aminotransferase class V-fold PLP-dependent enzyme [Elusimicrobiales bacterium]